MAMTHTSGLLTTKDLQALINVDKSTIYRMAEDGRIPAIKVGRQWRFPVDEIERWLTRPITPTASSGTATESDLVTLVPARSLQAVADLAGELLGVMAVVTDMHGRPLTTVANPCDYYLAVEDLPDVLDRCVDGWRRLGIGGLEPQWIPSHLGFQCARTFVRVGSRLTGMVIVGGIAPEEWPPPPAQLQAIADDLGVAAEDLAPAVDGVYHLDRAERRRVLVALPKISDLITRLAAERSALLERFTEIAVLAATVTGDAVDAVPSPNHTSRSNP